MNMPHKKILGTLQNRKIEEVAGDISSLVRSIHFDSVFNISLVSLTFSEHFFLSLYFLVLVHADP
jgi:hypothetical protein